jgi:hypothetical protein
MWKIPLGVEVEVLDHIVSEHPLEEVIRRLCKSALSSGCFSIRYGSLVVTRHRSISFSRRNPLLTKVRRSSVFNFALFHSFDGFDRVEGATTTKLDWHRRSHHGSSSSMCRSWCSSTEVPSSSQSRVYSLAFARGLRGRLDNSDGVEVDLIYSVVAAIAEVKGGGDLGQRNASTQTNATARSENP